jgi:20S proteasome subunit beta 3
MKMNVLGRLVFLLALLGAVLAQQQDPSTMNGGSILAMAGKGSVAVAVDKRFGSGPQVWYARTTLDFIHLVVFPPVECLTLFLFNDLAMLQMVNIVPRHVWMPHSNVLVAFVGLEGDVQSLYQDLQTQVDSRLGRALGFGLLDNKRSRQISPRAMTSVTSHLLYQRRGAYYVEPIVVGLSGSSEANEPFLCAMDMIGAQSFSKSFVCSGAASKSLYGTAEALWKPDLEPDELAEVCGKAFQSALERDCLSGYGVLVYLVTSDGVVEIDLASRND